MGGNEAMTKRAWLRTTVRRFYYNCLNKWEKWLLLVYGGECSVCGKHGKGTEMVCKTLCEECLPF